MFKRENLIEKKLDLEILSLLEMMNRESEYNDDYKSMAARVTALMEIRKDTKISKETWATIGANLAGLFMIMNHERAHIIATKGFSLLKKIV
jgi:hypothetical protein